MGGRILSCQNCLRTTHPKVFLKKYEVCFPSYILYYMLSALLNSSSIRKILRRIWSSSYEGQQLVDMGTFNLLDIAVSTIVTALLEPSKSFYVLKLIPFMMDAY